MNKLINLVKNKIIIVIVIISIISLFFIILKINNQKKDINNDSQNQQTNKITDLSKIIPGETSVDKINELLGEPINSTFSGDLTVSDYKSTNQFRNHKIYSKDGTAELIIEEIINKSKNAEDIRKIYGVAPVSLFENLPHSTFKLYLYLNKGIAYLGHEDGTILEIWYFTPTNLEDFKLNWASNFSEKQTEETPR